MVQAVHGENLTEGSDWGVGQPAAWRRIIRTRSKIRGAEEAVCPAETGPQKALKNGSKPVLLISISGLGRKLAESRLLAQPYRVGAQQPEMLGTGAAPLQPRKNPFVKRGYKKKRPG
jgi:hypothetical protein